MPPAGVHELPALQRPMALSPSRVHSIPLVSPSGRFAEPQQSEFSRQISPVGWQPLGGWQMSTPVGPNGKQARLQHSPPQIGSSPPSYVAPPEHTSPALKHPPAPVAGARLQRPSVAPSCLLQRPAQHSPSVVQVSPDCVQYEGAPQMPSEQKEEQQSE
jgi:hypothetical protein